MPGRAVCARGKCIGPALRNWLSPLLLLAVLVLLPLASASSRMTLEEANRQNEYAHKRIRSCNMRKLLSTILVLCKEVGLYNASSPECAHSTPTDGQASKRSVNFSGLQVLPEDGPVEPWISMNPAENGVLQDCCSRYCNYCMLQRYCCKAPKWAKKFCYYTLPYDA